MLHLKELGKFDKIRGVVFGRMTNCYKDEPEFVRFIKQFFKDTRYPILYRVPAGHIESHRQAHFSLPLGVRVRVNADSPSLEIIESAVK